MSVAPRNLQIETIDRTPKGGQRCGMVTNGVKVTHVPTGLSATCESERSQMRNRNVAIAMIEWGLTELGVDESTNAKPSGGKENV